MSVPKSEQVDHFVDVGGVKIEKLPDGFGVYESYAASSIANDVGDAAGDAVDVIGDVAGDVVDTVDENTGGSAAAPSYYGVKAAATVAGAAMIVSALAQS